MPTLSLDMAAPVLVQAMVHLEKWIKQRIAQGPIIWDLAELNAILGLFTQALASEASQGDPMSFFVERTMPRSSLQAMQSLGLVIASAITGNVRADTLFPHPRQNSPYRHGACHRRDLTCGSRLESTCCR